ncbi:hypothetical protein [Kribbella sancticallisti]
MTGNNGRLVALVAAVAVAAVAVGGALAYRQEPEAESATAEPLPGPSTPAPQTPRASTPAPPSATPSVKAPVTPPATPRTTPSRSPVNPVRVTVDPAKLVQGRAPQRPHLVGREVRGGGGGAVRIPGTESIMAIARLGNDAMAVVTKGKGTELLRIHPAKPTRHTPDVSSMISGEDGTVAYVAVRTGPNGEPLLGAVLYAETSGGIEKLAVPNAEVHLAGLANGRVYYRVHTEMTGPWKLYEWVPGAAAGKQVSTVPSASVVSGDGEIAASITSTDTARTCSTVTAVGTGKRLWKTCEDLVTGFTPDAATTLTVAAYGANGPAGLVRALETKSGKLIREWSGSFGLAVAEDDQHVLLHTGGGPIDGANGPTSAILRCDVTTGGCELATGLSSTAVAIGV